MDDPRTEKFRRLWKKSPSIESQLPISFGKELTWHKIDFICNICGEELKPQTVHGTITSLIPSVQTLEAIGICRNCKLLIPFSFRFRDDGAIEYMQDGTWVRNFGRPNTKWDNIKDFLSKFRNLFLKA